MQPKGNATILITPALAEQPWKGKYVHLAMTGLLRLPWIWVVDWARHPTARLSWDCVPALTDVQLERMYAVLDYAEKQCAAT